MIELLKAVAQIVIPIGTEAVVSGIAVNAVKGMGKGTKIAALISSAVIGWWVGEQAEDWLECQMDEFKGKWDQYRLKGADE